MAEANKRRCIYESLPSEFLDEAELCPAELRGRVLGPAGDTGAREEAEDEMILDFIRPDPFLMCSFMYWV